jgi:hypothetical protein
MPPEVVKTLPPVKVANWPRPDSVEWWTLYVASAAAFLALATLIAVWRQIVIAREELQAVKDDFRLSQEQFDLSQKQFAEIMKRPRLDVQMVRFGEPNAFDTFTDGSRPRLVIVRFFVTNSGDAVARDVLLEVFVPLNQLAATHRGDPRSALKTDLANMVDNITYNGVTYGRFVPDHFDRQEVVYPKGGYHMGFVGAFLFHQNCESTNILWRAFDQNGPYPQDGLNTFPEMRLVP